MEPNTNLGGAVDLGSIEEHFRQEGWVVSKKRGNRRVPQFAPQTCECGVPCLETRNSFQAIREVSNVERSEASLDSIHEISNEAIPDLIPIKPIKIKKVGLSEDERKAGEVLACRPKEKFKEKKIDRR